jgi:hypothetical protein
MNKRNVAFTILGAIQLTFIAAGLYFLHQYNDEAQGSKKNFSQYPECRGHLEGRAVCEVTGSDFFSASDLLDGRLVKVTGYLAVDHGVVSLYPNERDYSLSINNHALVVRAPIEKQRSLIDSYGYGYVR